MEKFKNLRIFKPSNGIEFLQAHWLEMCLKPHEKLFVKQRNGSNLFRKVSITEIFCEAKKSREMVHSAVGWSSGVCREFVNLGWCNEKEMIEFQRSLQNHDRKDEVLGGYWYRPDIVSEMEGRLLLKELPNQHKGNKKTIAL